MKINLTQILARAVYEGVAQGLGSVAESKVPAEEVINHVTGHVMNNLSYILVLETTDLEAPVTPEAEAVMSPTTEEANEPDKH